MLDGFLVAWKPVRGALPLSHDVAAELIPGLFVLVSFSLLD